MSVVWITVIDVLLVFSTVVSKTIKMNNFRHDNPGQSIFHGSDLANIQVNNDSQDENEDHLDKQRLDQEVFNNSYIFT